MTRHDAAHLLKKTLRLTAMGLVIIIAAGLSSSPAWLPSAIDCTTTTIDNAGALSRSDQELQATAKGDRAQRCSAYRRRVDILAARLTAVTTHPGVCFLSRGRGDFDSDAGLNVGAELSVFKRLADEACA